jgi:hypothetical protein
VLSGSWTDDPNILLRLNEYPIRSYSITLGFERREMRREPGEIQGSTVLSR